MLPTPSRKARALFWIALLAVVILLFARNETRSTGVLATFDGEKLRPEGLDPVIESRRQAHEFEKFRLLHEAVDDWIDKKLLQAEAEARSLTPEALYKQEITDKISVLPDELNKRYSLSPMAGRVPYDDAMRLLTIELYNDKLENRKSEFFAPLLEKHQARAHIEPPPGYLSYKTNRGRFPVYKIQPAAPDTQNGRVVAPPFRGGIDAPVLLEIYSDFKCPFSAKLAKVADEAARFYGDKLRIEYRHLPLAMHAGAALLAEASVCAQEQGKFWQFHDALFDGKVGEATPAALGSLASALGLDRPAFDACLSDRRYKARIESEIANATSRNARGTPTYFLNGWSLAGYLTLDQLKAQIDWLSAPKGPMPNMTQPPAPGAGPEGRPARPAAPDQKFTPEDLKDSPSRGSASAAVTVIEFIDFNCPYCKQGSTNLAEALRPYGDSVRLISKQFPLEMHPNAALAARAALCAQDQGKYWEFRDKLFGDAWGKKSAEDMKKTAQELKLDGAAFDACVSGGKTQTRVDADIALGSSKGVTGTPAFFVNGTPIVGARPAADFKALIDKKAAEKTN